MSTLEEYTRSLPNSSWLRSVLEYKKEGLEDVLTNKEWQKSYRKNNPKFNLKHEKIEFKILSKILNQCVLVAEGKPIFLTEEQWDWLYDYITLFCRNLNIRFAYETWMKGKLGLKEKWDFEETFSDSLNKYIDLFEKDIDSFLETNMPTETFRCVGCNKELVMRHMRVSVWSRNLKKASDESSELVLSQKADCMRILKDEIDYLRTDKSMDNRIS